MKKGLLSFNIISWVIRVLFLLAAILAVFLLVRSFQVESVDVTEVHAELIKNRMIYSPTSIMYVDPVIARSYPGIIDPIRFTDSVLTNAVDYGDKARITSAKLSYMDRSGAEQVAFLNKTWYMRWIPMVGVSGPGGATEFPYKLPVIILNNTAGNYPTTLKISIIIPNS